MKSYGLPWGEELIVWRAASNSINKGLYHPHHVTLGAYEKILGLISFTDHWDTHSPFFLLQGQDAAPIAPLPHTASLCKTQMNVPAHTLTQWPFSVFYTAIMLQCDNG